MAALILLAAAIFIFIMGVALLIFVSEVIDKNKMNIKQ